MAEGLKLQDALLFAIKTAIIGSTDLSMYSTTIDALYLENLPMCKVMGFKGHSACGFVCCPACEVHRRLQFGTHLAKHIAALPTDTKEIYAVHQRVTADELHELSSNDAFNSSATVTFFRRLNGLVAWRVNAGFDLSCRSWVFDRIAVVSGARPAIKAPTAARGVVVKSSADIPSDHCTARMPDFVGHYAGFLEYAMNLGPSPVDIVTAATELELGYVLDSVREAKARWLEQRNRFHLVKLFDTPETSA